MSNIITFFSEETDFSLENPTNTISWINSIATKHKVNITAINYIFCSDDYLLNINKEHLNHNYFTDIITFDLSEDENIESDIFISVDRVKENAENQNTSFDSEIHRVIIHGLLHLIGFDDKTDEEKTIMREKEDSCLSLLKSKT